MATGGERQFSGREKSRDVRMSNITAARALADMVRTSLGPKGMDKMIQQSNGEVLITNDGATILEKIEVMHPAAKMMVDMSKAQDIEAGDGTTSVVVICGALLEAAERLLGKGLHPSVIAGAFLQAQEEAFKILTEMAIPADLSSRENLVKAAVTSLNSKVVSVNSQLLAPLAVDAVLRITDPSNAKNVDLDDIKIVKKLGGTIGDTEMVDGLIFDQGATHTAGGPSVVKGAKIALIQFCLSAPKTNMENSVVVDDYQQIDRILKEERKYILKRIKPIIKSGCNVLLIQKSILRDAVNELSLHYLAKKKIMVIKDIERSDIEFISSSLGCTPIADVDGVHESKMGHAELVKEITTPSGKIIKVTGVKNPGRTVSVLVRGSNRLVIDEAERSVHDALCVIRCLVKQRFLIPGGGAPETEVSVQRARVADKLGGMQGYGMREFAKALEVVPYTLAENAGLNPIRIVTDLRNRHARGDRYTGINVKKGYVTDIREENVLQPLLVCTSALKLATETVRMMLKIDDIVGVR
jgi:T-complex protein 1 subunit delta